MPKEEKSSAPALSAGLKILELVSERELGFNKLVDSLNLSRGSVARIIKVLLDSHYLQKTNQAKYILGPATQRLISIPDIKEMLRSKSQTHLSFLMEKTECSPIIFSWDGNGMESLTKKYSSGSPAMQEIGTYSTDLSRYPWGWLFYKTLTEEGKNKARKNMKDPKLINQVLSVKNTFLQDGTVAYDKEFIDKHQTRLATLLRGNSGELIGAIGLGGNPLIMPENKVQYFGELLTERATLLQKELQEN